MRARVRACVRVFACLRACVRACVCMRVSACVCVSVYVCVYECLSFVLSLRVPDDSILAAICTVSPKRQYRGMILPTIPANTGPECRPGDTKQ